MGTNLRFLFGCIICFFSGVLVVDRGNNYDDESLDLIYKNAYLKGAVNQARGYSETQFKIDSIDFKIQYISR